MAFWDEVGWLAIGSYHVFGESIADYSQKKKINEVSSIIKSLIDEEFEQKLRDEISDASPDKFNEVWCRIEEYKRDNPHLLQKHNSTSYWSYVGKERFPFTRDKFCLVAGKNKLTKADEKMLSTYRGWTITLLMSTYGKYSVAEATRIAFRQVFGVGKDSWTREFG